MTSSPYLPTGATRPRLLLLTQWFDPEPTFKGLLFARELQERGYDVEVVTGFPNYPSGKVYAGYRIRLLQRETVDGVNVTRLALFPSHDGRALPRIANYLSFFFTSFLYMSFFAPRADVVYAYHPPLTVGLAAALAKLIRRTATVLDIQDMWPDTLSATGMVKASLALRIIGAVCRWVYARMTKIVVLSPGFRRLLIERGVPSNKITLIYNWADETAICNAAETRPAEMPENGRFRVLFAGNMGLAQNLDVVIDAAKLVQMTNQHIDFCFLGDGLEAARLHERVADERLSNVHFFPKVPMAQVGGYLAAADCLLVNLRPDPLFEITIPSKTQAYMSAGRPIVMAVAGDAADLIEQAKAGIVVPPGDAEELAKAILKMKSLNEKERSAMSNSGKNFYASHLSLQSGVDAFAELFHDILIDKNSN